MLCCDIILEERRVSLRCDLERDGMVVCWDIFLADENILIPICGLHKQCASELLICTLNHHLNRVHHALSFCFSSQIFRRTLARWSWTLSMRLKQSEKMKRGRDVRSLVSLSLPLFLLPSLPPPFPPSPPSLPISLPLSFPLSLPLSFPLSLPPLPLSLYPSLCPLFFRCRHTVGFTSRISSSGLNKVYKYYH